MRRTLDSPPNVPLMSLVFVCSSRCRELASVEAGHRPSGEAHRLEDIGIAGVGVRQSGAGDRPLLHLVGRAARQELGEDREAGKDAGAGQRQQAEHRVQQVDENQEQRHPGEVEECRQGRARNEGAHSVDVATPLQRFRRRIAKARHLDGDLVSQWGELGIQPCAGADEDLRADDVEHSLEEVEPDRQNGEGHQGRHTAARQGPVVDLQHVEGAGQRQDVDDAGQEKQEDTECPVVPDIVRQGHRLRGAGSAFLAHETLLGPV